MICYKNDIKIDKMTHALDASNFMRSCSKILEKDVWDITCNVNMVYPAAGVPIAGIIDQYKKDGKKIYCHYNKKSYLSVINFSKPYLVSEHLDSLAYPFAKIWKFTDFEEITKLVDAFLKEIQALTHCSSGLIEGLEWSLNEVMDNVIQHSQCQEGYVMGVYHKSTDYVIFNIYDNGQGIFNSLKDSEYHPRNAIDAISIAIQEGKTRDKSIGQGNGLWGLYNIIQHNKGKLCITSSGSALMLKSDGQTYKFDNLPVLSKKNGTTSVDISFNCKENISIAEALGGYKPISINFENSINDNDWIVLKLKSESSGFGTRVAGERLRNKTLNDLTRLDSPGRIIIDFDGVSIISSSFADEFLGKLLQIIGFYRFNNVIKIINANETTEIILNRSISQRMAEIYKS